MFLNILLIGLVLIPCRLMQAGRRAVVSSVIGATVTAYLIVGILIAPDPEAIAREREKHPIESLQVRLAYEKRQSNPIPPHPEVLERLAIQQRQIGEIEWVQPQFKQTCFER
jgi:hypothetical protein